jgi:hypothetical protein
MDWRIPRGSRSRSRAVSSDIDLGIYYHPARPPALEAAGAPCASCLIQALFALNRCDFLHEKRALEIAARFPQVPEGFANGRAQRRRDASSFLRSTK